MKNIICTFIDSFAQSRRSLYLDPLKFCKILSFVELPNERYPNIATYTDRAIPNIIPNNDRDFISFGFRGCKDW
jgi:hypothetical protein